MQQTYLKHKNLYSAILLALGLPSMAIATPTNNPPLTLNNLSGMQQDCTVTNNSVDSLGKAFSCGTVSGAIKTAYYSLNNAYFGGKSKIPLQQAVTSAMKLPPFMAYKQPLVMTSNVGLMMIMDMPKLVNLKMIKMVLLKLM